MIMKRKTIFWAIVLVVVAFGGYGYYVYAKKPTAPVVATAKVTRGDIVETVGATGQLQAVTTVQVGTQVSGTVQQLNADFNSLVHKGEVIARLDPSLFQTQIEQARANLVRAQADLERFKVAVDDAQTKLRRAEELSKQQLIAQTDLEAAQVTLRSAQAQLQSQQAAVTQAQATLDQNEVNLQHTIIEAPIDGLVISRSVDVGQTVAASMQAPTLFVLAADLTKMQVIASLDESDVGRIRPGQKAQFRVDAYPAQQFSGTVTQVRLQPIIVQNVVTYSTVIDVPNTELKLKPGMTANVTIEIARSSNVLRVPNSALRFRPTAETFQAFGQTPPSGPGNAQGAAVVRAAAQREAGTPMQRADDAAADPPSLERATNSGATTIDALFGPLPPTESRGQAWVLQNEKLSPVRVRLGLTDGQQTELLQGDLKENQELVTNITTTAQRAAASTTIAAPGIFGQQNRGGFQGGGGGFGGGGLGGGR